VLLDERSADAIELVVGFCTADDVAAVVKSDLIKAVHAKLDAHSGKHAAHSV